MSVTKISLVQWLITYLNVILHLSTCHTVYVSVLILFIIMPQLIINTYVSLMYKLKKIGKVFTSKFVGTGPSSHKKRIYRAAVWQRLRNTGINYTTVPSFTFINHNALFPLIKLQAITLFIRYKFTIGTLTSECTSVVRVNSYGNTRGVNVMFPSDVIPTLTWPFSRLWRTSECSTSPSLAPKSQFLQTTSLTFYMIPSNNVFSTKTITL